LVFLLELFLLGILKDYKGGKTFVYSFIDAKYDHLSFAFYFCNITFTFSIYGENSKKTTLFFILKAELFHDNGI
jgi:hypothetical protein